jgi:glycosyltransferase involved in cell wall biosynthesis
VVSHPKVSILMPVRNGADWLGEALESIRGQTFPDWELVAVDDGSTDSTPRILEAYRRRDGRLRVLATSERNRGIVAALNCGLDEVRGRYVARVDADDVALPERLAEQVGALDEDAALAAVSCCVEGFPEQAVGAGMRRYLAWQNALVSSEDLARDRFVESPVVAPSLTLRTEFLRAVLGGWQERGWPEDWDLVLRTFEAGGRIARVTSTLHRWRQHPRQTTRNDARYGADRLLRARAHYLARFLGHATASRAIWLLGAGPVGKTLAEALFREGLNVAGFAEVDQRKIGNRIRRAGQWWPVISMAELQAARRTSYAVAAVGRSGARVRIREALTTAGWVEERDFIAAA